MSATSGFLDSSSVCFSTRQESNVSDAPTGELQFSCENMRPATVSLVLENSVSEFLLCAVDLQSNHGYKSTVLIHIFTWMLDKNHPQASRCKIQARRCSLVSKCSWHFLYLFQLQIRRKWEIIKCEWWEAFETILTFLTRHLYAYHNSLWTGSQFFLGKKVVKGKERWVERALFAFPSLQFPLDQRPGHRLYHK